MASTFVLGPSRMHSYSYSKSIFHADHPDRESELRPERYRLKTVTLADPEPEGTPRRFTVTLRVLWGPE